MPTPKTPKEMNIDMNKMNNSGWDANHQDTTSINNESDIKLSMPKIKFSLPEIEFAMPEIYFHTTPLLKLTKISVLDKKNLETTKKLQSSIKTVMKLEFPAISEVTSDDDIFLINREKSEKLLCLEELSAPFKIKDDLQISSLGENLLQSEIVD